MRPRQRGAPAVAGRRWRRLPTMVGAGVAAGVLLASCSSGGNPSANHSTTTTSGRRTTTTTTPGTTTTSSAPATTTTTTAGTSTAGTPLCQPGQLSAAAGNGTGAAGTLTVTVSLTNTSSATCTMDGYPGMQLLDAQGAPITTTVVRDQFHFPQTVANQPPAAVRLAPKATAAFTLAYEDVPVGGETSCPTSAQAEITPPNDYTHLVMALSITPCGNGTVHVSPVYSS